MFSLQNEPAAPLEAVVVVDLTSIPLLGAIGSDPDVKYEYTLNDLIAGYTYIVSVILPLVYVEVSYKVNSVNAE